MCTTACALKRPHHGHTAGVPKLPASATFGCASVRLLVGNMPPQKPASATKTPTPGKKPTSAGKSKDAKGAAEVKAGAPASDDGTQFAAPTSQAEALAQVSFDGLPTCPQEEIIAILESKYDTICKIFAHYCKYSECKTIEMATRIRLGPSAAHRTAGTPRAAPRRARLGCPLASPHALPPVVLRRRGRCTTSRAPPPGPPGSTRVLQGVRSPPPCARARAARPRVDSLPSC